MIRHDHPSAQIIAHTGFWNTALHTIVGAGKVKKVILDELGNFRSAQMALAAPVVEVRFKLLSLVTAIFEFREMLPLGTERFWKAVSQVKGDELGQARLIPMRQITSFMPAAKA